MPVHPQIVMHAAKTLGEATKLASRRLDHKHAQEMTRIQAGASKDFIDGVLTRQIDVIQEQCKQTLSLFADQARHYMSERATLGDARRKSQDRVERAEIDALIVDIDSKLAEIRADAQLLYARMSAVLITVGRTASSFMGDTSTALALNDLSIADS